MLYSYSAAVLNQTDGLSFKLQLAPSIITTKDYLPFAQVHILHSNIILWCDVYFIHPKWPVCCVLWSAYTPSHLGTFDMPRTPPGDIPNTPKTQTHLYDVDLFLVTYGADGEPYWRHKRGSLCDSINGWGIRSVDDQQSSCNNGILNDGWYRTKYHQMRCAVWACAWGQCVSCNPVDDTGQPVHSLCYIGQT